MDFIQNLPFPDHAFCSDLARPWIPMDRGYRFSMFFNKSVPGFHFRQNPWISSKIYPSQTSRRIYKPQTFSNHRFSLGNLMVLSSTRRGEVQNLGQQWHLQQPPREDILDYWLYYWLLLLLILDYWLLLIILLIIINYLK